MLNAREKLPERAKYTYSYAIAFSNGMAALKKQKKYNWKETNLAQFGSELEKQVRHVHLKLLKLIFVRVSILVSKTTVAACNTDVHVSHICKLCFTDQEGKCGGRGCMEGSWDEGRSSGLEDCPV